MLQGEHSAILSTFIKLPFVIKIFFFVCFECFFNTGFSEVVVLFDQNVSGKPTCFVAYFFCLSLDQDFLLAGQRTDIEEVLPLYHNLMRLNDFLG